jgi:hypothetical protein
VLAEIIKTSTLDVEAIAAFVRSSQIDPDWMSMQLPLGMFFERGEPFYSITDN